MTDTTIPTEEELDNLDPDRDSVVAMEPDEGVKLRINLVSGFVTSDTRKQTYTRSFGHYFISDDSKSAEILDSVISDVQLEQQYISKFNRLKGQAYEVQVIVDDNINQMDAEFKGSNRTVIEIPSHSQYIESVHDFLDKLRDE